MRRLILFRHGLAEDQNVFKQSQRPDRFRPLVDKGISNVTKKAKVMKQKKIKLDLLVTSPHLRAIETAQILQKKLKIKKFKTTLTLAPDKNPLLFFRWLKKNTDKKMRVLVVGHEPQLSRFAAFYLQNLKKSEYFEIYSSKSLP